MDEKLKSPPKIDVYFVLLPGSLILDWAGPAEAIRIANQLLTRQGGVPRFELHFICPSNAAESSVGVMLSGLSPLPTALGDISWIVLLGQVGSTIDVGECLNFCV
jgi:transcriptional regulator GlxA family with amidase domain